MSNLVKSIFRQREVEKIYELQKEIVEKTFLGSHKVQKISVINNENEVISDKEIGRYDIETPILEVGDEFFLHDTQTIVTIKSKMRSSDGSITYYVKDKVVETEKTKKSYDECEEVIKQFAEKDVTIEKLKRELDDKTRKYDALYRDYLDYRSEYKYKNRFFNFT